MNSQKHYRLSVIFLVAVILAVVQSGGFAQQRAAVFPVIVVLEDAAPFESFREYYVRDERAAANPAGWNHLDAGVAGLVQFLEGRHNFRADHVYSAAIRGFAARLTASQIAEFQNDPYVADVEIDGTMTIVAQTVPWGITKINGPSSSTVAGDGAGAITNVNAYIIDTGIDTDHLDLNVVRHVNFASGPNRDCNGHGTHVAGTVAAKDNTIDVVGVAPGAPLTGVKVLGCGGTGSTSGVIAGIDWVTANAQKPAVANMSLGGSASNALDNAVRNSAASGVFYAVAAGNEGTRACEKSPARAGAGTNNGIMTVAATNSSDTEASWSNYGNCVDIWAPGVSVLSTRKGGGTTTMSGTSMASPHGAGAGALYLSASSYAGASASDVEDALKSAATPTGTSSKDGRPIMRLNVDPF